MSKIIEVKKAPAVVKGAVLEFNADELSYLGAALEVAYKAHKSPSGVTYVSPIARSLWQTIDAARKGSATVSQDIFTTARPF